MCGGTSDLFHADVPYSGLSPRVRGNPRAHYLLWFIYRSIPACAGEPCRSGTTATISPVYPRVCGGTYPDRDGGKERKVYPRVCGGTLALLITPPAILFAKGIREP